MLMLAVLLTVACGQTDKTEPPGAATIFVSNDPVMVRARELLAGGRLAEAERLLEGERGKADTQRRQAAEEALEIVRRYRREYGLDLPGLVNRLRRSIPDVTAADVERWRDAGQVQWRMIDGKPGYFIREPSNIFRFCDEAKRRRDANDAVQSKPAGGTGNAGSRAEQELIEHLAQVVAAAESGGTAEVVPLRHRIRYKVTVQPNRPGARAGSLVRCWMPFAQEYRQQKGVKLIRTSPSGAVIAPNAVDGRRPGGAGQRTVYLEQTITDPTQAVVFEEEFEYISYAFYPRLNDADARPLPADWNGAYLGERLPHIAFTPELRQTAERVVASEANPLARARKLFHFVATEMKYCAEEEYTVIPSFSEKALASRKGDCGIQSMLFVALCRAAGIPARWQSGWETRPREWNMHDWAEFYVEPWGWLPADASYGLKKSNDPRIREFYFGHQDSYRLIVNVDYGCPLHPARKSLRSEPADFQRGEVEIDGRNLYFDEWDYDFQFDLEAVDR